MRLRLGSAVLIVALTTLACSPSPTGPSRALAPDQVTPDDAVKATGARAAADAFVRAYAKNTGGDLSSLGRLVGSERLRHWVHWLGVQDREFPGTMSATVESSVIGPAIPFAVSNIPGSDMLLREVDVRATIAFELQPVDGEPISFSRSLDGPMRLLFDQNDRTWRVLDFTRDGFPLSQAFEVLDQATLTRAGITVSIDAFVSIPYWEFFLKISSDARAALPRSGVELVDASGRRVALAREVTPALEAVAVAGIEGIVTFPPQPSADGLTLRLAVEGAGGLSVFEFPLGGTIHPIPMAEVSPSPTP